MAAGRGSGRKQRCDHVTGLSVSLGRVRWVPLALRGFMGARCCFEWKLGGIWPLSVWGLPERRARSVALEAQRESEASKC